MISMTAPKPQNTDFFRVKVLNTMSSRKAGRADPRRGINPATLRSAKAMAAVK
jgi:hypothetical protein